MKEINGRSVFYNFYRLTEGGFYSEEEGTRLLRLLSRAAGNGFRQAEAQEAAVRTLRENGVNNDVRCRNFLLVLQFASDPDPWLAEAAEALLDVLEAEAARPYTGRTAWCRGLYADSLRRGFYEYATGDLAGALKHLGAALPAEDGDWSLLEVLAVVSREARNAERGLEYALRAQWVGGKLHVAAPHLERIEAWARKRLGTEKSRAVEEKARTQRVGMMQIGFTS